MGRKLCRLPHKQHQQQPPLLSLLLLRLVPGLPAASPCRVFVIFCLISKAILRKAVSTNVPVCTAWPSAGPCVASGRCAQGSHNHFKMGPPWPTSPGSGCLSCLRTPCHSQLAPAAAAGSPPPDRACCPPAEADRIKFAAVQPTHPNPTFRTLTSPAG